MIYLPGGPQFWVKFPTVRSLTRVKCPGIARGGGWAVLELTGTLLGIVLCWIDKVLFYNNFSDEIFVLSQNECTLYIANGRLLLILILVFSWFPYGGNYILTFKIFTGDVRQV